MVPTPVAVLPPADVTTGVDEPAELVDSLLAAMSLEEKVGQLIMPWLLGNYAAYDSEEFDQLSTWIDSLHVGGILISVGSPLDAPAKLNRLQRDSRLPLLVAADLEWGTGMRFMGATSFPMVMGLAATGMPEYAYELGRVTAAEARATGIHLTFSPVADVNSNPSNPIINTRSFGEDAAQVSRFVSAYIRGAEEHGLFTTAKHFPGHGDTDTDSHIDVPFVRGCWDRLDSLELVPFRAAIDAGASAIMSAHVALECAGQPDSAVPATLAPSIIQGLLKDSLGFEGLVVTDALSMGALVRTIGSGEIAVRAFLAGNDLLLSPSQPQVAHRAMVDAVESGRISPARLDGSVRKILHLKERAGLFEDRTVDLGDIPATVGRREHQDLADSIAARSLTLIQDGTLNRFTADRGRVAVISYAEETNLTVGNELIRQLRAAGDTVNPFRLYPASGPMSYDSASTVISQNPRVVFAASVRFIAGRGHIQMSDPLAALIVRTARSKATVLVSLGSPYLLEQIPGFEGAYLLAWSDNRATERAAARAVTGLAPITGTLPVTLSEEFPRGFGLEKTARR